MRGRTNIGGGGIAINATVEQKTIKSGNIIAGDFVEYFKESEYIEQTQNIDFVFSIGDYDIAKIMSGGVMLAAFKNGIQVATYAGYNCQCISKYNNFILFLDTNNYILGVLSVSDNGFELVSSVEISYQHSPNAQYMAIAGGGGKVCYWTIANTGGSSYYFAAGVADISNSGVLSNYVYTVTTKSSTSAARSYYKYMFYYNGLFYAIDRNSGYSYPVSIDENNVPTFGNYVTLLSNLHVSYRLVFLKDNIFALTKGQYGSVSTQIYGTLLVINFVTGNYVEKTLPQNGEMVTYIKDDIFIQTGKIEVKPAWDNTYKWYIANSLLLCRFDNSTYEITILDRLTLDEDYQYSPPASTVYFYEKFKDEIILNLGICDLTLAYAACKAQEKWDRTTSSSTYQQIQDPNIYLFDIENNHIQDFADENYVIPYAGGNYPIGVAKDTGTANDVIDVYIPAASS